MFQKAKNMDEAFQQVRLFCALVIVGCLGLTALIAVMSFRSVATARHSIYVLSQGKILEALQAERKDNLEVEARDHVKTFHQYFFTLAPDDKVIEAQMTRALYLADGSARDQYESLKENNYYSGLLSGNISQQIIVDSVRVVVHDPPYYFECSARQIITRPSSLTTRLLRTSGYLREVPRSDNNPHGFLIEKWKTLDNHDLSTEPR